MFSGNIRGDVSGVVWPATDRRRRRRRSLSPVPRASIRPVPSLSRMGSTLPVVGKVPVVRVGGFVCRCSLSRCPLSLAALRDSVVAPPSPAQRRRERRRAAAAKWREQNPGARLWGRPPRRDE